MSDYLERDARYGVVPELLGLDYRVSDRAFRVWFRLDRFAGDRRAAFPNRATLADELECSVATLDRAIEVLVETGWLTKKRKYAGGGNVYKLISHPTKANGKIIEAAIQAKIDARKQAKHSGDDVIEREHAGEVSVKDSQNGASSQVNEGGVLTHEDTPSAGGGVLTHEDTLSSPMRTPVLTHEDSKDSSPKEASKKELPPSPHGGNVTAAAATEGALLLSDRELELHTPTEAIPARHLFVVEDPNPAGEEGAPSTEDEPTFEDWWEAYPKRVVKDGKEYAGRGKAEAKREWARAIKKISPRDLYAATIAFRDDPNRYGGLNDPRGLAGLQYLPDAQRWLKHERWADGAAIPLDTSQRRTTYSDERSFGVGHAVGPSVQASEVDWDAIAPNSSTRR